MFLLISTIRLFFDFLKKLNRCRTGFEVLFKVFIFASGVVIFAPFDYVFHFVSPFLSFVKNNLSKTVLLVKSFLIFFKLVWLPRIELGTYWLIIYIGTSFLIKIIFLLPISFIGIIILTSQGCK